MAEVAIHGRCDPWFHSVFEVFADHFARGVECGAAVSVVVDDRVVVDLWAGVASRRDGRAWSDDTLVNVYSATKGVAALCLQHLADQGRIECAAPVARYWPEFGMAGKEAITVQQLLSHQGGLAAVDELLPSDARYDHVRIVRALERQMPDRPPGYSHAYHAQTFGFLVGELVRRCSGLTLGTYLKKYITGPRALDFWIGLDAEHDRRVAHVTRPIGTRVPQGQPDLLAVFQREPGSLTARAFNNPAPAPGAVNTRAFREVELPGSNGHGTACALAQLYAAAVGAYGPALLSTEAVARCCERFTDGEDGVLRMRTSFGVGCMRSTDAPYGRFGAGASGQAFGHPGMGGCLGCADPAAGLGFGYTTNLASASILVDPRAAALLDACYRCL